MRIKVQVVVEPDEEGAASVHEMTQLARGSSRTRVVQPWLNKGAWHPRQPDTPELEDAEANKPGRRAQY